MLNSIKTLSVLSMLLLMSCSSDESIENDSTVLEFFSGQEAKDLQKMHDFFSDQICEQMGLNDPSPNVRFKKFMKDMKESGSTGSYTYVIPRNEIDKLFNSFESDVFSSIWKRSSFTDEFGRNHETIHLDIFGKYSNFLQKTGEEDVAIADYHQDLLSSGTIGASTVAIMLMFPEKYNTEDCRTRLVIAVHYITCFYQPVVEAPE